MARWAYRLTLRAWGDAHPVGMAVGQALGFALAFGVLSALTVTHRSLGSIVARAAAAGVIFGLLMWAIDGCGRRHTDRAASIRHRV